MLLLAICYNQGVIAKAAGAAGGGGNAPVPPRLSNEGRGVVYMFE